ncbi:MAG TPA: glycosyltransferase [Desulfobacteraceae bacterium]|nr:glycosyltransferase [Desulfobacteraceae bacterium]
MGLLAKGSLVRHKIILLAGDFIAGLLAVTLAAGVTPGVMPLWGLYFVPLVLLFSFLCEVYLPERWSLKERLVRSVLALGFTLVFILVLPGDRLGAFPEVLTASLLFFICQNGWQWGFHKTNNARVFAERVIVIGTGATATNVENLIRESPGKYELAGYIKTPMDPVSVDEDRILGEISDIVEIARETNARAIIIALTERRGNLAAERLVTCKLMGVKILDYPNFFELMTGKIPVEHINPSWLVQSSGFLITPFIRSLKKVLDLVFSSVLLTLCLPFFPIIALMIKLDSPGPVFYLQQRVGLNGKVFTIYKFRSMGQDSEKETGASWAQEDDPRVTRFVAFMRKTRIDELPQLFNVLKGDMSFIGPRPERPEFVSQISKVTPYYAERHAIKPGITGWAQVNGWRGETDTLEKMEKRIEHDLAYIRNWTLLWDIKIIFLTVFGRKVRKNAY